MKHHLEKKKLNYWKKKNNFKYLQFLQICEMIECGIVKVLERHGIDDSTTNTKGKILISSWVQNVIGTDKFKQYSLLNLRQKFRCHIY